MTVPAEGHQEATLREIIREAPCLCYTTNRAATNEAPNRRPHGVVVSFSEHTECILAALSTAGFDVVKRPLGPERTV